MIEHIPPVRFSVLRPASALAILLAATIAFTLSFTPLRSSHDEWWHLKTGRYIDEHGLPGNEIFTYTAQEIPWHNHEWLAQLGMWRVYRWGELSGLGGVRAVIALKTLFVMAAFAGLGIFCARSSGAPALSALAAGVGAGLARRTLYPRPPFISYAFMALTLGFMMSWRARRARTWLLALAPPFFALWSNLHGGFIAGLVIMGAFSADAGAAWALARWRDEPSREPLTRFIAVSAATLLSFGATLLNPSGWELYALIPRVMEDPILTRVIFELLPPDWRFVWALDGAAALAILAALRPRRPAQFVLAVVLIGIYFTLARVISDGSDAWSTYGREAILLPALVIMAARTKGPLGLPFALLLPFFAHQSIHHVRHLPLFGIVLVPALAHALAEWVRDASFPYDAFWAAREPVTWKPEERDSRMNRAMSRAESAGLSALALIATFYLFWPGEAWYFLRPDPQAGATRQAALRSSSHLKLNLALARGTQLQPGAYPVEAVDYLLAVNPPGRLWNAGNYAGYLIWRVSPEKYKVFTDNRYDIYGSRFIRDQEIVINGVESADYDWRSTLEKWRVNTVFIPVDAPVRDRLAANSEWRELYNDGDWSIWTRNSPFTDTPINL